MKKFTGLMLTLVTFALMATMSAFARDKNHHSVEISEPLQVGNARLPAGDYTMEWSESGATAEVNFLQHGKSVAQAPAKIVTLAHPPSSDSVTTTTGADNMKSLEEVEFGGHKEAFSFSDIPSGE